MAYVGSQVAIPLGALGLKTDDAATSLPPNAAIVANNVSFYTGNLSKSGGSIRYNSSALSASIVALWDYFPTPSQQRLIAVTSDGKVFRDTGDGTFTSATAIATGLGALTSDVVLCEGGAESAGVNKKLFIFTGASQLKVLSGDTPTVRSITYPALDWASNFPTAGIVHNGRLFAFGNTNNRHTLYASRLTNTDVSTALSSITIASPGVFTTAAAHGLTVGDRLYLTTTGALPTGLSINTLYYVQSTPLTTTFTVALTSGGAVINTSGSQSGTHSFHAGSLGHEDFMTAPVGDTALTFGVYPGEGDGLVGACEYQGRLFLFKRPFGVYYLDDSADPSDYTTWSIKKLGSAWGIASPHGAVQVLSDLIGANTTGSYTSLQATNALGDVVAGDILSINQIENYIRGQFDRSGISSCQAIYYAEKKLAYFTARSIGASSQDRMLVIDVARSTPRFSIETKDAPNCLALRKDSNNIPRPIYGGTDGYVYQMDQITADVNGQPYLGEFQTAYTDFSFVDQSLAAKNKIFDFIDVDYVPLGSWAFYIDVYVDGIFKETVTIQQRQSGAVMGSFIMGTSTLSSAAVAKPLRKALHCTGKTISFRIYNNGLDQSFKVDRLLVSFRLSGEQQQGA